MELWEIKRHITAFPMLLFHYSVLIFFRLVLIHGWEKWSTETCWIPAPTCMKMPSSRYTPWCTETLFQGFWTLRFISLLLKVLQALLLKLSFNFQTNNLIFLVFFGWVGWKKISLITSGAGFLENCSLALLRLLWRKKIHIMVSVYIFTKVLLAQDGVGGDQWICQNTFVSHSFHPTAVKIAMMYL